MRTHSKDAAPEFVFNLSVNYSFRCRDYDKKSKAICADHPYSKRKAKDEGGEKSDQDNDSSADEAPAAKKVKVDARMVTNQRTGVPVTGSSASDDSCQSQPAKTPPHSAGNQLPLNTNDGTSAICRQYDINQTGKELDAIFNG